MCHQVCVLGKISIVAFSKDEQLNVDTFSVSSGDDMHTDIFSPSLQDSLFSEDRDEFISIVFFSF